MSDATEAEQLLKDGLRELGVAANPEAIGKILSFAQAVLSANERTNLIGPSSPPLVVVRHVLDSIAPVAGRKLESPTIDLGSGAGFPGVPLAVMNTDVRFILLEPRRKRFEFLAETTGVLKLENVQCLGLTSAGALRHGLGASAGVVLARALAKPEEALHLGMPLVKPGGVLLLYEGRASTASREFKDAIRTFGASLIIEPVRVPFLGEQRHLWTITAPTASEPA